MFASETRRTEVKTNTARTMWNAASHGAENMSAGNSYFVSVWWVPKDGASNSILENRRADESEYGSLSEDEITARLQVFTLPNTELLRRAQEFGPPQEWWDDDTDLFSSTE